MRLAVHGATSIYLKPMRIAVHLLCNPAPMERRSPLHEDYLLTKRRRKYYEDRKTVA